MVRNGEDYKHPAKEGGHHRQIVYTEMIWQITRDYSGLPDIRTLNNPNILFFYEGLREELKQSTKPESK